MAQRGGRGAELKAGLVVLVAIAILILGIFLVSGGFELFTPKRTFHVLFEDSGGIGEGDPVLVAGRKRGQVLGLDDREAAGPDGVTRLYVDVEIEVEKGAAIHRDAGIRIAKTITGIVTLSIDYGESREAADPDKPLFGVRLATFDEVVDQGQTLLAGAQRSIEKLESAIDRVDTILQGLDLDAIDEEILKILDTLNRSALELEGIVKENREPIRGIVGKIDGAVSEAQTLMENARGSWDRFDPKLQGVGEDAQAALRDVRELLEANRGNLDRAIQNLRDATERIGPFLGQLELLSAEAYGAVAEIRPHLVGMARTGRVALANFTAITEDLKTAPWKLVNKPSSRESKEVNLLNAMRLYVVAAEKVRTQIDDLDTLRRLGVLSKQEESELVELALERLKESLDHYEEQEAKLMRLMAEITDK